MSPCVLVLCPHAKDRTSLVRVLTQRYTVLDTGDVDKALGLLRACPGCRLAYCGLGRSAEDAVAAARALKVVRPALSVIALTRQPGHEAWGEATGQGLLTAVRALPLSEADLLAQTRAILIPQAAKTGRMRSSCGLLTREEIDFLLGRVALPGLAPCPPVQ